MRSKSLPDYREGWVWLSQVDVGWWHSLDKLPPGDPDAWGIYSDWLEDEGREAEAEVARLMWEFWLWQREHGYYPSPSLNDKDVLKGAFWNWEEYYEKGYLLTSYLPLSLFYSLPISDMGSYPWEQGNLYYGPENVWPALYTAWRRMTVAEEEKKAKSNAVNT